MKSKNRLADMCRLFGVLSDQTRLRLLQSLLSDGQQHVSQLCSRLKLPQPTVSHHLGLLRAGGLVQNRRMGKRVIYSTDRQACQQIMAAVRSLARGK